VDLWELPGPEAALGRSALSFWEQPDQAAAVVDGITKQGQWRGEMRAVTLKGRTLELLLAASIVDDAAGAPVALLASFVDITERKRGEDLVRASLEEKEALLKEVHHRVKNNLQVISSLLRLELGRSADSSVKAVLGEMQNRVLSMALLHETLYRSDNFARVNMAAYLGSLANQIFRAAAPGNGRVALKLAIEPQSVSLEQAVPCGLLVTELLSNSLKHAFPGERSGEVQVALAAVGGGPALSLTVRDTGAGLPADFSDRRTRSLGLQLVSDLTRQLRGTLDIGEGPGASFTLNFTPREPGAPGSQDARRLPP
jgi:two-component sensor histidine kinase